jgi:hypothetical protein
MRASGSLSHVLFEANDYIGGHTRTIDVTLLGKRLISGWKQVRSAEKSLLSVQFKNAVTTSTNRVDVFVGGFSCSTAPIEGYLLPR